MKICGIERPLEFTVGSVMAIEAICEGEDIANIGKLFDGSNLKVGKNIMFMAVACSKAHEDKMKLNDPNYEPHPITAQELSSLSYFDLMKLSNELADAYKRDFSRTVETEPAPKNTKGEAEKDS